MAHDNFITGTRQFKHLSFGDRGKIEAFLSEGHTLQYIADYLGYTKSTISRERKRGSVSQIRNGKKISVYFADSAQRMYLENRKACGAKYKLDKAIEFITYVDQQILEKQLSPDAICGEALLKGKFKGEMVCTKTLYRYIDMGLMQTKNIDLAIKVRLNTKKIFTRKNKKHLGKSIEERPINVNDRTEFGHWEIDTMIGKKSGDQALLTLTERMTRKEHILRIDAKDCKSVSTALEVLKKSYGDQFSDIFQSITSDNGSEFAELTESLKNTETVVYYTHPYTSCERGSNERQNGLIRRFIPKGKSISTVAEKTIEYAELWCNHLPRKILGYFTAEERFQEELLKQVG